MSYAADCPRPDSTDVGLNHPTTVWQVRMLRGKIDRIEPKWSFATEDEARTFAKGYGQCLRDLVVATGWQVWHHGTCYGTS